MSGSSPTKLEKRAKRGARQAPRQVGYREGVVGRRRDEVAPFAVLVEQHVDAARLALAMDERRLRGGELGQREGAVVVAADATNHGRPVAEAGQRVHRIGRLAAAGAHRLEALERRIERRPPAGLKELLSAGRTELVPLGKGRWEPVDQVDVERPAADQLDGFHTGNSPR